MWGQSEKATIPARKTTLWHLDLGLLELLENKCLLFKPHSLCYFVMEAWANNWRWVTFSIPWPWNSSVVIFCLEWGWFAKEFVFFFQYSYLILCFRSFLEFVFLLKYLFCSTFKSIFSYNFFNVFIIVVLTFLFANYNYLVIYLPACIDYVFSWLCITICWFLNMYYNFLIGFCTYHLKNSGKWSVLLLFCFTPHRVKPFPLLE